MKFYFLVLLLGSLVFPGGGYSQTEHGHNDSGGHDHSGIILFSEEDDAALARQVKIEEQPGSTIALDTWFNDENGERISLASVFDRPVVLLPIFFSCTAVCNILQADLADVLNRVGPVPGKDFNVVTLSFADEEDHTHARTAKNNYNNLVKRDYPLENWFYLTGDVENIRKVTDSLGYYFVKTRDFFYIHPSAMVVLAADGKIIRYLYGPGFLPFDLGMALNEAEKGEPGISIKRGVLAFCFDYDSEKKTYVFKAFRVTGTVILVFLAGFIVFLLAPSGKKTGRKDKPVS